MIKRSIFITLFLSITVYSGYQFLIWSLGRAEREVENNIGKRVLINKDTLTVVGYYSLFKAYKLSNGADIDKKTLKENLLK